MKTLHSPQITVTGDTLTLTAKISDMPFSQLLVTRVSHGHMHPENSKHPRRIQSSSEAVFVESPAGKFAIPNEVFAMIAAHAMPESSFPPHVKHGSSVDGLNVVSETPLSYQWQISDNAFPEADKPHTPPPAAVWTDIAGETGKSLDAANVKVGQWTRCVIKNLAGQTITQAAKKT